MADYFLPLEAGRFYHIFNRGNNGDLLFYQPRNYDFFLQQFISYLGSFLNFYAYCLLPNHFHLLVQVKKDVQQAGVKPESENCNVSEIVSEQFRRFFLSYAAAIKRQERRTGSLFEKNFKRQVVPDKAYLKYLVNYIHRNPETHKLVPDFRNYSLSSYNVIISNNDAIVRSGAVISWFGDLALFITYHEENEIVR